MYVCLKSLFNGWSPSLATSILPAGSCVKRGHRADIACS